VEAHQELSMRCLSGNLFKDGSDHFACVRENTFSYKNLCELFDHTNHSHGGHHVAVKSIKHALEDGRPLTIESNSVSQKEGEVYE